ncbi:MULTISPECIES: cell envelope biogenesis protein OmpA [unclassified Streptomyces]|uniref:cell envelope biogenesis protein OmpA n=1 Tax=unclassified Streptomyces TaxID=2593676 RepID=UPI003D7596EF
MRPVADPAPSLGAEQALPRPAMILAYRGRSPVPLSPARADLLRLIADPATPVFLTVHAGGRRRYGYWQPVDGPGGRGRCYAALPTDACDTLHRAGRITLGEAVVDPAKTTYRVRAVSGTAGAWRAPRAHRRTA